MRVPLTEWLVGPESPRMRLYVVVVALWCLAFGLMVVSAMAHIQWLAPVVLLLGLGAVIGFLVLDCANCLSCGQRFSGKPFLGRGDTFRTHCAYCGALLSARREPVLPSRTAPTK